MSDKYPSRRLLNLLTAEMVTWLDAPDPNGVRSNTSAWDEATWQAAELVALMQGIGPYLHHRLSSTLLYDTLPAPFRDWLAAEYALNGARVARLHADLAAVLRAAGKAGIAVMPLKGSLLTTRLYEVPAQRPMADLDLLIRPADGPALTATLQGLGYQLQGPLSPRHNRERIFVNPGGCQIASWRSDHPDNPRPIEVHLSLKRSLWVDAGATDLTDYLWAGSQETEVLGERARVPAPENHLVYLAMHATGHHLMGTGRFIQLLDLAQIAPQFPHLDPPDANWVYPALRLAARGLPGGFGAGDLSALAQRTHPRLRRWAETVPLDGRCGLNVDPTPPSKQNRWRLRWVRWHPSPERLALAYGDTPLFLAYPRHVLTVLRHLRSEMP